MKRIRERLIVSSWAPDALRGRCRACGRTFHDFRALLLHLSKSSECLEKLDSDYYICPKCGNRFKGFHGLQLHISKSPECYIEYNRMLALIRLQTDKST